MAIETIEERLASARQRLGEAMSALSQNWAKDEQAEYWNAQEQVLRLERELAAAKGQEHAVPLDLSVRWGVGSPLPHLLCNDYRALLSFTLREDAPEPDRSAPAIVEPSGETIKSLALIEFMPCVSARLGSPNDEALDGHPLHGRGLEPYTAQRVINSRWIAEIEAINKIHRCYDPAYWRERNHYVFWFHDTTFECIAKSLSVEVYRESVPAMLTRMCQRLVG